MLKLSSDVNECKPLVVGLMPFVLKNEGSALQRFLSALVGSDG